MTEQPMHRTDAHALHAILSAVVKSKESHLQSKWAEALGAQFNTVEFALRHAEVVDLYTRTVRDIEALPEAKRRNYRPYAPAWWTAVVGPQQQWGASSSGRIIDTTHLSLLHGVGDVIEARLDASTSAPAGGRLDELEDQVRTWVKTLEGDPAILPNAAMRNALIQQLQHVLWLVENAHLFGASPVAVATQQALGGVALASPHVRPESQAGWKAQVIAFFGVLAMFNYGVDMSMLAVENSTDLITYAIDGAGQVRGSIDED